MLPSNIHQLFTYDNFQYVLADMPAFPIILAFHAYFTCCQLRPHVREQHWLFSMITCALGK
jgi:hypothetical protein